MQVRPLLKWASLAAISIAAVFALADAFHHDTASAAIAETRVQDSGSLQMLGADGKPAGDCPLKHTEVKAKVSGFLSRVTVTQEFENNFAQKIEAVYTFPLPEAAAVDDLTMLIGDRVIKGKVLRREEAQAAYAAAKETGKLASLLDQEQPNIFRQQVANILPGEQIRITISYVETLKYDEGSYEWTFPIVVAQRYVPNKVKGFSNHASSSEPSGGIDNMRAGHDISLEIEIDAGVPIIAVTSETHETEVQQMDEKRTVVHLKDRATIPNKDFVLTYKVAGDTINDAVLAHRSERGGFFTLILQPPQRVAEADVMPRELVFVLDTSGSMEGFPIEKAKQTMKLALDTLHPNDTFNLITFAGETEILFSQPVPATPENLRKAKKFLSSHNGEGGTEMMGAIKAALDPSDSQQHVRLACFMTDGQVGNDAEILAEVVKHPNARVFAMGFGDAPNRSLLDKMSRYGRGEVNYVTDAGNTSSVAQRFNDRIRNPLLTDLSVEWSDLAITEVYPKRIPDLFSAKPVILSGRYSSGGKGTIRLKGKMAGQDFVREIPVELPETEEDHDVLASLWARTRIEDLMAEEIANSGDQAARDQRREEIAELGLKYKLMTAYTSFIAIDDKIFTGADEPQRVDVPVATLPGTIASGVAGYVTVMSTSNCTFLDMDISAGIVSRSIQSLPLQGRSVASLYMLDPGTAAPTATGAVQLARGSFGQNTNMTLDGVNTNFGIAPGGESPGISASGNAPALTASGGANGLISFDAVEELEIKATTLEAEYGRNPQMRVTTRAGTNEFHGSVFHFFGNDALDASDWFANARGLRQPPKRLNLFGGTLGGPIKRNHAFFFASYEGMRLRQPMTGITDVPSLQTRAAAPAALLPFMNAFPIPNGNARPDGFAEFAATFANPARHDAGSFRLDHNINAASIFHAGYNFADSNALQRGGNGLSLNTTNLIRTRAQMITGSFNRTLSATLILDLRANYSRSRVTGSYLLDEFGGATVPADLFPSPSFAFDLNSRNAGLMTGVETSSIQRQFSLGGSLVKVSDNHNFAFGGDYRRLSPSIGVRAVEERALFDGAAQALTGTVGRINRLNHAGSSTPVFNSLALFAQDEWKQSSRLTLTYGLRWELAPPPSLNGEQALAVDQVNDPTRLNLQTPGSSLWKTTFTNFAPRAAITYKLSKRTDWELTLRGGTGILYDLSQDRSGDAFVDSIPFISGSSAFNAPFPLTLPTGTSNAAFPLMAFDPQLKLPYTINWNASLQQALGRWQAISVSYFASSGKRLLHTQTLFDQNPQFPFLRVITNRGESDYRALQLDFERHVTEGLQARVGYTWSRSLDNVSADSARAVIMTSTDPALDRGPSDFDSRHQLTGSISYGLPAPFANGVGNKLFRNWALESIFTARSGRPLNVVYLFPTSVGVAYLRPDLLDGVSPYVLDPAAGGGRRLNSAAFQIPSNLEQGNLGRNSLRGFPLSQIDLALHRKFSFSEAVGLKIEVDAFNLLNHPNFEDPLGNDLLVGSTFDQANSFSNNLAFGQSTSLASRGLSGGGFGSFYSFGGARTLRLSVKLLF